MSEEPDSPETPAHPFMPQLPAIPAPFGLHSTANERIGALADRRLRLEKKIARISRHALATPGAKQEPDDEDGLVIRHPVMWIAVIDREMRLMDLDLKVHQEVYDVDRVREYLHRLSTTVMARILEVPGEVADGLRADLQALNREFNIGGEPGRT